MTASWRHPLEKGSAPPWAIAWGDDRYGIFAAFAVGPTDKQVEQRMRWIPPGIFTMGSPETEQGRYGDEGPQHEVILTAGYWLGETPVTQALWIAVMGKNPSRFRRKRPRSEERPVEQVSWDDCQMFIDRINARIAAFGARLPTEAEWERACRARTTAATWVGDLSGVNIAAELEAIAWYQANSGGTTRPVGCKAPNPYGLYDMLGNVWEWCADDADRFGRKYVRTSLTMTDPVATGQGKHRFHRGGAWNSSAVHVRAAYRNADPGNARGGHIGFRLAASHCA